MARCNGRLASAPTNQIGPTRTEIRIRQRMRIVSYPDLRGQIGRELHRAMERLGADRELLAIIGSYGGTLTDEQILRYLKEWNTGRPIIYSKQDAATDR
jgi:hypothetical protein